MVGTIPADFHRRNSIKAAAIKAEDEYAAVVKAAAEAEAAEELAKNPVPDAKSGDEDGSEENEGADGVGEEDTGFGGDLADAAAEDEVRTPPLPPLPPLTLDGLVLY